MRICLRKAVLIRKPWGQKMEPRQGVVSSFFSKIKTKLKNKKIIFIVGFLGLLVLVAAAFFFFRFGGPGEQPPKITTGGEAGGPFGEGNVLLQFRVKVPDWTPKEDNIYIYSDSAWRELGGGFPMKREGDNLWTFSFYANSAEDFLYKYNRNNFLYPTDELFTPDHRDAWRRIQREKLVEHRESKTPLVINDEVKEWRWSTPEPPKAKISSFVPESLPQRDKPFVLGMGMIDFHSESFNPMIAPTMKRIKEKGFEYVQFTYYPSTVFLAKEKERKVRGRFVSLEGGFVLPGRSSLRVYSSAVGSMSDEEFDTLIKEARKQGLKLMMVAILNIDPNNLEEIKAILQKRHPDKWWQVGDEAWEEAMVRSAKKAVDYQIEIFSPEVMSWAAPEGNQEIEHHQRLTQSFAKIRQVYPGILTTLVHPPDLVGFKWYKYLDWMSDKWVYPLAQSKKTILEEMVLEAKRVVRETYAPLFAAFGKPILLQQVMYHANDGAAGGLMIGSEGPELAEWFPDNPNYPADLQEQADAYEAVFQAVYDQPFIAGAFSFSYTYWDSYDKSGGIRSKPAEEVWARWSRIFEQKER